MLLDALKDFSWENEPANVCFVEKGMLVETEPQTDFWQNAHHHIAKDNGHFFFTRREGDFCLTIKWHFTDVVASDQCGIMLRADNGDWVKAGFLTPDLRLPQIGSVVTLAGFSDWAAWPLVTVPDDIWLRAVRRGGDFVLFASIDGRNFRQIRMFSLPNVGREIKVGAYACSPQNHSFRCVLESIE